MTGIDELEQRIAAIEEAIGERSIGELLDDSPRSVAEMVRWVAFQTGARSAELTGPSRQARHAKPRFAIYWCAREARAFSFPRIARALGGRDHSTIVWGYRRALVLRETDAGFRTFTDRMLEHFAPAGAGA